ncbi:hypothetical protein BLNAU_20422 [Blattamonas nauphoetae]|uniref:Uncharacterized protein n=1 Tax=Blattamonas nauphoetae TaxID=2049346 RepID=A0ABQ9WYU0_9EUKA|nr:hypothetical protein BLNAU_20422 [Blattamonas nauphoetae]
MDSRFLQRVRNRNIFLDGMSSFASSLVGFLSHRPVLRCWVRDDPSIQPFQHVAAFHECRVCAHATASLPTHVRLDDTECTTAINRYTLSPIPPEFPVRVTTRMGLSYCPNCYRLLNKDYVCQTHLSLS